jgi:Pentapeptide repeats (8 copies)
MLSFLGMFNHCYVEDLLMCWLKRDMWKAGIAIAGMVLLLLLMTRVSLSAASAHEGTSELATPGTVTAQATPTVDATVTTLNKEKLAQEVQQLKNQNEPDPLGWLRTNASILLSTLVVVVGGLFGLWRWRVDRRDAQDKELKGRQDAQDKELADRKAERERRDEEQQHWLKDQEAEREKRAEERFQSVVEGLSSEREEAKVGAAIMLRTFLRPGYEQFYTQTFDLAVAHLRLPRTPHSPEDPDAPLPLTTLSQALIAVFKEVFPLARSLYPKGEQPLVARGIQLDNAYPEKADLEGIWMPQASLRNVDPSEANLSGANLSGANLSEARLSEAKLVTADLSAANLDDAESLRGANLRSVKGLTKEQLAACKAKGAIIDEDPATSASQPTAAPPPSSQSNDAQASSAPSAQGSVPTPGAGGISAVSSQQDSES